MCRPELSFDIEECKNLIIEKEIHNHNYNKTVKRNSLPLCFAVFLVIGLAIGGGIYAKTQDGAWYSIFLFAALGGVVGYVAGGILFLICKPFCYSGRKKLLSAIPKLESYDLDILDRTCSLLTKYIEQTPPQNLWDKNNRPHNLLSLPKLQKRWLDLQNELYYNSNEIRINKIELTKLFEWVWIVNSLALLILGIVFIVAVYIFIWLVVIILTFLIIYFATSAWKNDHYRPATDDVYENNGDGLFKTIWKIIAGPINNKYSNLKRETDYLTTRIKECIAKRNELINDLNKYYYPNMDSEMITLLKSNCLFNDF